MDFCDLPNEKLAGKKQANLILKESKVFAVKRDNVQMINT